MEKEQKKLKVKIISLATSILVCVLLVGVSVWAALTQNVKITNTISITTDGQVAVKISAFEYAHKDGTLAAVSTAPDLSSVSTATGDDFTTGWKSVVTLAATDESKEGAATPIVFNAQKKIVYYAYKFEIENTSTTTRALVSFGATAVNNAQITVYYGDEATPANSLTTNTAMSTDNTVTLDVADGGTDTATFYIVVVANTTLGELTPTDAPIDFNITINVTVAA